MARTPLMKTSNLRFCDSSEEGARALQHYCRESMKLRLLADILQDMTVCRLEGWDILEFVRELHAELERILNNGRIHTP